MSGLKSKRAPSVSSNERAWSQVYDDINDIIKAVNNESGVESRDGASGKDGDIRLFKDVDRTKYFIEGKFGDGWAKRELLFSDNNDAGQDETINFSSTETYIKPDGTVPFTAAPTSVAPSNDLHLATKKYVDDNATDFSFTGDITGGSGSATINATIATNAVENSMMADNAVNTAEITNNAVTYTKLQQINTDTFLGRDTAGTGNVEEITISQLETMLQLNQYLSVASLNTLTDVTVGYSGVGAAATGHYLRYNGTNWVTTAFQATDISGLQASQIPPLATSKITSGTFNNAQIKESSVTQHSAAVKSSASLMSNFFFQEADNSTTSVEEDHKVKIVTNNGGGHGTGTISTSGSGSSSVHTITLNTPNTVYSAGTNVSFNGTQINSTDTNTNQLTRFYIRDDDNDDVYLAHNHYVKFDTSGGVTTNWNATDAAGSTGSPHILTIGFDQSSITTVGTITSGTWSGSVIPSSKLDSDTAHLSGTQTFSGAKTFSAAATMYELNIDGSTNNATNDATLYITASNNNDWGIKISKPSGEYGQVIDVAPDSAYALRILGNGTQKFNITGAGKTSIGTTNNTYDLNVGTNGAGIYGTLYMFSQALYSYNGSSYYMFYNDSNVGKLQISDTSGSNYRGLTIQAGGTGNDAGRISTTGRLYVGGVETITAEPTWGTSSSAMLQVKGFARVEDYMIINSSSDRSNSVGWRYDGGIRTFKEGSGSENVYAGADVVAYYSSDPKLKKNKKKIKNPLKILDKINGYTFDWKNYAKNVGTHLVGSDYGVMADEIEEVMPELVHDRDNGYKGVKYEKIVPLLIECIKEQQVQINQLKKWKEDKKWI